MDLLSTPNSLASALTRMPFFSAKTSSHQFGNLKSQIRDFKSQISRSRFRSRARRRLGATLGQRRGVAFLVGVILLLRVGVGDHRLLTAGRMDRLFLRSHLFAAGQRLF